MNPPSLSLAYQTVQPLTAVIAGERITYLSKPGLPHWDEITPAQHLLAEGLQLEAGEKTLLLGCHVGIVALALARRFPHSDLLLADEHWAALQLAQQNLKQSGLENARLCSTLEILPAGQASFDVVGIDLPKGRRLAQRWLALAAQALRPGGRLFLAGQKDQGIQPLARDAAQIFGEPAILAYRKGNRLLCFYRPQDLPTQVEWWNAPGVQPGSWLEFTATLPQIGERTLVSLPGVFSSDRLDDGTLALLEQLQLNPSDRVLDLGCGYGVIGLTAACLGVQQVYLLDVSLASIAAAQENARRLGQSQVRILPSDVLSAVPSQRYTRILTNPPFHAGHQVDHLLSQAFVAESWQALEAGGQLWLVANRFLGYEKLARQYFSRIQVVSQDNRYLVLCATK